MWTGNFNKSLVISKLNRLIYSQLNKEIIYRIIVSSFIIEYKRQQTICADCVDYERIPLHNLLMIK